MFLNFLFFSITHINAVPLNVLHRTANSDYKNLDNYSPKLQDYPKFYYTTFGDDDASDMDIVNLIEFKSNKENSETSSRMPTFMKEQASIEVRLLKEASEEIPKPGTNFTEETTVLPNIETTEMTVQILKNENQPDPIALADNIIKSNRTGRQEDLDEKNNTAESEEKGNQENEEDEEEEEEPNMVIGLISAFLSGLSRPDGSVDVEAITGLLGSLSTQNEDGSYDFNGLTEILMSFFGGGGEEGGGSDFGAFVGGLAGALLKGIANPPGSKGVGIFLGNVLGGIFPALSAPAPTEEGEPEKPQQPLDSGGFLGGFLSSVFGNLANLSGAGSSGGDNANDGGGGNKFSLFKAIFSMITSVLSSSSAAN